TPASRRSHHGDFGRRGRASPHRHCGRIGHSELPHPGRSARRGAPASRGDSYEQPPRDATPRSAFRMPPDDAPSMSKAGNLVVNIKIQVAYRSLMATQLSLEKRAQPAFGLRAANWAGLSMKQDGEVWAVGPGVPRASDDRNRASRALPD